MRALVAACLAIAVASCVRAPASLDINALVLRRGPVEARRDLAIRVLAHPRDVQARLALAALAEQVGRPGEAIEQLEAVRRLGGPIGTRWHAEDRARLGRLLLARGRARLARSASSALDDLRRAASLGAVPSDDELVSAKVAAAVVQLRHVDAKERAGARAVLATHARPGKRQVKTSELTEEASWLGARDDASPSARGAFGAWCWSVGARREAYEQLHAWHLATRPPRDAVLQGAYLRAFAWWAPLWLGEVAPPAAEDLIGPERCWFPGTDCPPPANDTVPLPPPGDLGPAAQDPRVAATARYAATRFPGAVPPQTLATIAAAFQRDPNVAERLARDATAAATDAAVAHAAAGALFDGLGDAARARTQWQNAVELAAEPAFLRGLAEAIARTGEGPAALVVGHAAAAASGDPAVVWNAVASALGESAQHVDAMTAARSALDLAGPDELPRTLDLAIETSRALRRTAQADALVLQRAQLAPHRRVATADALAALAQHRARPTAATAAQLWVVSRSHVREIDVRVALLEALDADDPRRTTIIDELVGLAADEAPERAYAAVAALRRLATPVVESR